MTFKKGDRVKVISDSGNCFAPGDTGTIDYIGQEDTIYVDMDKSSISSSTTLLSRLFFKPELEKIACDCGSAQAKRKEVEPGDERVGDIVCGNGREWVIYLDSQFGYTRLPLYIAKDEDGIGWQVEDIRDLGFTVWREEPEAFPCVIDNGRIGGFVPGRLTGKTVWVSDRKPIKFEGDE